MMLLVTLSMMTAFLFNKSILVSPGFCETPAVMTTKSASLQSEYVPALILIFLGAKANPWFKSIASPMAFS